MKIKEPSKGYGVKITELEVIELYNMFNKLKDDKEKNIIKEYMSEIQIERNREDKLVVYIKYKPTYNTQMVAIDFKGDFTKI